MQNIIFLGKSSFKHNYFLSICSSLFVESFLILLFTLLQKVLGRMAGQPGLELVGNSSMLDPLQYNIAGKGISLLYIQAVICLCIQPFSNHGFEFLISKNLITVNLITVYVSNDRRHSLVQEFTV